MTDIRIAAIMPVALGLLGACSGERGTLLGPVEVLVQNYKADYQLLATCSFQRLDARSDGGLKKTDLPSAGIIKLTVASSGVRYFDATFTRIGPKETKVAIDTAQTMWGPYPGAQKAMDEIAACAATLAT